MAITPRELRDIEIKESLRGYNRDEVNDLLERAAATVEENEGRIAALADRLAAAESTAGRTRESEDVLNRTLLLAQRAADEAREEATREARRLVDDAEARAARIVADAESDARERAAGERERLDQEIGALAAQRDAVRADLERLEVETAERRAALVARLEADLAALRSGAEVPSAVAASGAAAIPMVPVVSESPGPERPNPAGAEPAADPVVAVEPAGEVSEALLVDDGDRAPEPAVAVADAGPPTSEVDMQSLFGDVVGPDEPAEIETIEATATALFGEAGSGEVLDDDAFFATLREAVDDDAPLGPRDEDLPAAPFDQDAKESGFRDVFRRRR